jgi:hypothetical protein
MDNFDAVWAAVDKAALEGYVDLRERATFIGGLGAVTPIALGDVAAAGANPEAVRFALIHLDPADYAQADRTTKFRLRASVVQNGVSAGVNFTFGLYPVTINGGASGSASALTLGTVISGSPVTVPPGGTGTHTQTAGSDFDISSAGAYAVGVKTASGTQGVGSVVDLRCVLQRRHV